MNRLDIAKQVRKTILDFIKRNPGTHYSEIMRRLNLSSGRLAYHLAKLEEAGKIFAEYDGYWKRFYQKSMKGEKIPRSLTPMEEKIFKIVKRHPGLTYVDLVKRCGKTRQLIYYHFNTTVSQNSMISFSSTMWTDHILKQQPCKSYPNCFD